MFVAIKFQNLIIKKPYYKLRYTIWNFATNATKPILSILKVHQFYKVTLKTLYNDRLAFNFANTSFFMDYLFNVTPCLLAYFPWRDCLPQEKKNVIPINTLLMCYMKTTLFFLFIVIVIREDSSFWQILERNILLSNCMDYNEPMFVS